MSSLEINQIHLQKKPCPLQPKVQYLIKTYRITANTEIKRQQ